MWIRNDYKGNPQVWYSEEEVKHIKEIAEKALNLIDYKTYFKRDNKSLKQEGFKALNEILKFIESTKNDR